MSTGYYNLDHHVSRTKPRKSGSGRPWYPSRSKPIQIGVIHTAESLPDFVGADTGAEAVSKYGATTERASWHDTIDSDSWVRNLPHEYTAFHVKGYNSKAVGLEIATKAAMWVDTPMGWRYATLDRVAAWVAEVSRRHNLPIRYLSKAQVDSGLKGFTGHGLLDPARRSDPGDAFPWDYVLDKAKEIIEVPPEPRYVDRDEWPSWAIASIETMIEIGVLRGDGDVEKRFYPNRPVTRAELAVALDRLRKEMRS